MSLWVGFFSLRCAVLWIEFDTVWWCGLDGVCFTILLLLIVFFACLITCYGCV